MSYFEAKELKENCLPIKTRLDEIKRGAVDAQRSMTDDEFTECDSLKTQLGELETKIRSAELVESIDNIGQPAKPALNRREIVSAISAPKTTQKDEALAFTGWLRQQAGLQHYVRNEHRNAAEKCKVNLDASLYDVPLMGLETICRTADPITSFSIAEASIFAPGIEKAMLSWGNALNAVNVITTDNANTLSYFTHDNTTQLGVARAKLDPANAATTTLGKVDLSAYSLGTSVVMIPNESLEDNSLAILQLITDDLGEQLGRKENKWLTTGVDTTEPCGIETAIVPAYNYTEGDGSTTGTDYYGCLTALQGKLDEGYQNSPKCGWMMNRNTFTKVDNCRDLVGRPLLSQPENLTGVAPYRLKGKPVWVNQDMTNDLIIYGDWSKMICRFVRAAQITVLKEYYAIYNAIGIVAFHRMDSACINTDAFVAMDFVTGSEVDVQDV